MDLQKLRTILEKIMNHPNIKKEWKEYDKSQSSDFSRSANKFIEALEVVLAGTLAFGGKKALKLDAIIGTLILLIKLTVFLKERVVDDPEIQKWTREAWDELAKQSSYAFSVAQNAVSYFAKRSREAAGF